VGDGVTEEVDGLVDAGRHVSVTVMYDSGVILGGVLVVDGLGDLARDVPVENACGDMSAYSY
jgi:hypothetical protein